MKSGSTSLANKMQISFLIFVQ